MAYSNEYLTVEEIELLKQTEHWSLIRKNKDGLVCLQKNCTVDREKCIWLIEFREGYSYDPSSKEKTFVIFWGKIHKNNMIEICLKYLGKERDDAVKMMNNVELIKYWAVKDINLSPLLNITEEDILNELEELMAAYGISGDPEDNQFKGKIKVIFKEYK